MLRVVGKINLHLRVSNHNMNQLYELRLMSNNFIINLKSKKIIYKIILTDTKVNKYFLTVTNYNMKNYEMILMNNTKVQQFFF